MKRGARTQRPEWEAFQVTRLGSKRRGSEDRAGLSTVYHIVHLPAARRILEDGRLKAGLIYDKSKLNRSRICVTWLSANTWVHGSIYGNVKFAFDWADIIEGRRIYWVEAIAHEGFDAYRFLLTKRDMSNSEDVVPYDPGNDNGPLQKLNGEWYWNANYTSEFMLEADIPIRKCTKLSFVEHYSDHCRTTGTSCEYQQDSPQETAARMLAFLLSSSINRKVRDLLRENRNGTKRLTRGAKMGINGICLALGFDADSFVGRIRTVKTRQAVLLGALALYGAEQDQDARALVALLNSQDVFEKALGEAICKKLGVTDSEL